MPRWRPRKRRRDIRQTIQPWPVVSPEFATAPIQPKGQYDGTTPPPAHGQPGAAARTGDPGDVLGLIDQHQPRVVTWNGRGFVLPVLKQRSLIHGLAALKGGHRADPAWVTDTL